MPRDRKTADSKKPRNSFRALIVAMHFVLHFALHSDIITLKGAAMYEYFDFDPESAVFEWDDEKEQINFRKHGIHFKTAAKVFLDPDKLIREDEEHRQEKRYDILGKVGKVLFVVCAFREENTVRMISARLATVPEKERYEHGEDPFE